MKKASSYHGITLIEMMISLLLSLSILSLLFDMLVSIEHSSQLAMTLNRIQYHAIHAIHLLTNDLSLSASLGCTRLVPGFPVTNLDPYHFSADNALVGQDGKLSDEMTVRHASIDASLLMRDMTQFQSLLTDKTTPYKSGELLIISDCQSAEMFVVKQAISMNNNTQLILPTKPLHKKYLRQSAISHLQINHYLIKSTTQQGEKLSALFVQDITGQYTELVSGITAMHLRYVVNIAGTASTKRANEITHWADVIGIHLALTFALPSQEQTWFTYVTL